jgi:hypothetical protein
MPELTPEQTGWLDCNLSTIAQLGSLAQDDYDVLAWAETGLDAWEQRQIRTGYLPEWYWQHCDTAAEYLYDALLVRGAKLAARAALNRLRAEPTLTNYVSILLAGQRELLWLEHLRWLNCADINQIAALAEGLVPPYISRCQPGGGGLP